MKFMGTETRIFLIMSCLSVIAFFAVFILFMPLVYEHRLISYRFSPPYVMSFLYVMSLYFVLTGALSVLVYRFFTPMRAEARIFIITFAAIFWAIVGASATASLYWGNPVHPLDPLGFILMWGDWQVILIFSVLSLFLLVISTLAVVIYRIYGFIRRVKK